MKLDMTTSVSPTFWKKLLIWTTLASSLVFFGVWLVTLRYVHEAADDYCLYNAVHTRGFFEQWWHWFQFTNGRVGSLLLINILYRFGSFALWIGPAVAALSLIGALWYTLKSTIMKRFKLKLSFLERLAVVLPVSIGFMMMLPNPYQNYIWLAGITTFVLGLALMISLFVWVNSWTNPSRRDWISLGVLGFLAATVNEPLAVISMVGIGLIGLSKVDFSNFVQSLLKIKKWVVFGLIILFGFGVNYFAPGTLRRRNRQPDSLEFTDAANAAWDDTLMHLGDFVGQASVLYLIAGISVFVFLISSAKRAAIQKKFTWQVLATLHGFAFISLFLTTLMARIVSNNVSDRSTSIALFVVASVIAIDAFILLTRLKFKWLIPAVLVLSLGVGTIGVVGDMKDIAGDAKSRHHNWHPAIAHIEYVRATNPVSTAFIRQLRIADILFPRGDRNYWVNRCMAEYYGVEYIRARFN